MSELQLFKFEKAFVATPPQLAAFSRCVHAQVNAPVSAQGRVLIPSKRRSGVIFKGGKVSLPLHTNFFLPEGIESIRFSTDNLREVVTFQQREEDGRFRVVYRGLGAMDPAFSNYYANLSRVCVQFNPFGYLYLKLWDWSQHYAEKPEERRETFRSMLAVVRDAETFGEARQKLPESFAPMVAEAPWDELWMAWRGLKGILMGEPVPQKFYAA